MPRTWSDYDIDIPPWRHGEIKVLCPQCSHTRRHNSREKCLSVNIDRGLFNCHHCEWSGSLGYDERDWRNRLEQPRAYAKPEPVLDAQIEEWGEQWLTDRGISRATAERFGVYTAMHYFPQASSTQKAIVFPYIKDGETINNKYRGPKKIFAKDKDMESSFYNFDALKDATDIFIVEGECDVLAFAEAGITEVISVPNGGTERSMDYLESAMPYLANVVTINLAVDMDAVGQQLEGELARRLGRDRCKRIVWPGDCKDANEVLVKHGKDALRVAAADARFYPVGGSVHFSDLRDELYKSYHHKQTRGYLTGWETLDKYYTVRLGEMTMVTGVPGSGKSEWLASLLVNLVQLHGFSFSIFSAENYDDTPCPMAEQLIRKWVGKPYKQGYAGRMSWGEVQDATDIFNEHFAFINPEEPTLNSLLEIAKLHLTRLGIKGLVLDPWNEITHDRNGLTETDYIGEALRRIRKFARMHDIHVWVVAHPTKMARYQMDDGNFAFEVPTPYSVSGCYSDDTEVLTDRGWKRHQDLDQTERVACFDPATHTLRYEQPTDYHEYDFAGEMHRFKGESFDMLVTPNHRMLVRAAWPHTPKNPDDPRIRSRDWHFIHAEDLTGSQYEIPYAASFPSDAPDNHGFALKRQAIVGGAQTFDTFGGDEFLQYLGWWIAEGCVQSGGLSICQAVGPLQERMKATMDALHLDYTDRITAPRRPDKEKQSMWVARIKKQSHSSLTEFVRNHAGVGAANKRLPDMAWRLSTRQKRVLFDALIDGDGNIRANEGGYQYATTSRQLADDVMRLAIELGMPASLSEQGRVKEHHKDRYIVQIGRARPTLSLRTPKHLTKVPYDGKVYCLTVPTGAYLTRRNGKMAICGNSANWFNKPDNCLTIYRFKHDLTLPSQVHVQKIRKQPDVGTEGMVEFNFDWRTSSYTDVKEVGPSKGDNVIGAFTGDFDMPAVAD